MAKAKAETVDIKGIVEELKESFDYTMRNCFTSPNVADSNFEPAGLVDVVQRVAIGLHEIGVAINRLADSFSSIGNTK